jgi:hypothetical protein
LRETLRLWSLEHGESLGLGLGAAAILAFGLLLIPHGSTTTHMGRVTGFRALSTDTGTEIYATVDVEGHPTLVQLHAGNHCEVGSAIALRKARFPLGDRYAAGGQACAPTGD